MEDPLRLHLEHLANESWFVWAAVVLDGTIAPSVVTGRLRVCLDAEETARAHLLRIVAARFSGSKAASAVWVKETCVPAHAHAEMTEVLLRKFKESPARTSTKRLPLSHRRPPPGRRRLLTLIARDGGQCCWCGKETLLDMPHEHPDRATVEHIVPRSKGGSGGLRNLKVACHACNASRADSYGPPPTTGGLPVPVKERFKMTDHPIALILRGRIPIAKAHARRSALREAADLIDAYNPWCDVTGSEPPDRVLVLAKLPDFGLALVERRGDLWFDENNDVLELEQPPTRFMHVPDDPKSL